MSINANQLREKIVRPTLKAVDLWSQAAENLLMGTCAQESNGGHYIVQTKGPAKGIFQCEPATHDYLIQVLKNKPDLYGKLSDFLGGNFTAERLVYDLRYATIICRLHYLFVPAALPDANDINALGAYYKKYYNTYLGKATVNGFVNKYNLVA